MDTDQRTLGVHNNEIGSVSIHHIAVLFDIVWGAPKGSVAETVSTVPDTGAARAATLVSHFGGFAEPATDAAEIDWESSTEDSTAVVPPAVTADALTHVEIS